MTIYNVYHQAKEALAGGSCENPSFEAMCLMTKFFGIDRTALSIRGDDEADALKSEAFFDAVKTLKEGMPLQYVMGSASFYGYEFAVGRGVLIPRFDSEILIDTAKKLLGGKENPVIIDLCAGSGAIAVTLAKELQNAKVFALELSGDAYVYLCKNIKGNNVEVTPIKWDVLSGIPRELQGIKADLIVSNPPYVTKEEMKDLSPQVRCEPPMALLGGDDGLLFYRVISFLWQPMIKKGGSLLFETGSSQRDNVMQIMKTEHFWNVTAKNDLSGNHRVVFGTMG